MIRQRKCTQVTSFYFDITVLCYKKVREDLLLILFLWLKRRNEYKSKTWYIPAEKTKALKLHKYYSPAESAVRIAEDSTLFYCLSVTIS